jgi:hypothetical protein
MALSVNPQLRGRIRSPTAQSSCNEFAMNRSRARLQRSVCHTGCGIRVGAGWSATDRRARIEAHPDVEAVVAALDSQLMRRQFVLSVSCEGGTVIAAHRSSFGATTHTQP